MAERDINKELEKVNNKLLDLDAALRVIDVEDEVEALKQSKTYWQGYKDGLYYLLSKD